TGTLQALWLQPDGKRIGHLSRVWLGDRHKGCETTGMNRISHGLLWVVCCLSAMATSFFLYALNDGRLAPRGDATLSVAGWRVSTDGARITGFRSNYTGPPVFLLPRHRVGFTKPRWFPTYRLDPASPAVPFVDEYLEVPIALPLAATVLLTITPLVIARRKQSEGKCDDCGYNLTGNESGKCPECGASCAKNPAETT